MNMQTKICCAVVAVLACALVRVSGEPTFTVTDLGTLGGNTTTANSVAGHGTNAAGLIVGSSTTADNSEHAFLYAGDKMYDLNTLCDLSQSGFKVLTVARTISDSCVIIGDGITNNGDKHAFMLTPLTVAGGQWTYQCCQWVWIQLGGGWWWEENCGCYRWHGPPGRHPPCPPEPPPCWWYPLPCPPPCRRPTPTPTPTPPTRQTPTPTPSRETPTPTPTLPPPVRRTPTPPNWTPTPTPTYTGIPVGVLPTPTPTPPTTFIPGVVQPTPTRRKHATPTSGQTQGSTTGRGKPRTKATSAPVQTFVPGTVGSQQSAAESAKKKRSRSRGEATPNSNKPY